MNLDRFQNLFRACMMIKPVIAFPSTVLQLPSLFHYRLYLVHCKSKLVKELHSLVHCYLKTNEMWKARVRLHMIEHIKRYHGRS